MEDTPNLAQFVLIIGTRSSPKQAFLVMDKKIVTEIEHSLDIPFVLMSAFLVFNIQYPLGCSNLYSFFEILVLNFPSRKASLTVKHFLSTI